MADEKYPDTGKAITVPEVCRACLTNTDDLRSIFKEGMICGQVTKLADMLASCTNLEYCTEDGLPENICNKCVSHLSRSFAFIQLCLQSDDTLRQRIVEQVHKQYVSAIEEARFQLEMQPEIEASSDTDSLCDDGERLAYGQVKPGVYTLQEDTELVQAVDVIEQWIDSTTTVDQPDDEQQTPNDSLNVSADDVRNTGDIVSLLVDLEDRRSAGNQEVTLLDNDDSVEFCMDNDDDIIEEDDGITYEEHHLEDEADEGDDLELVQHSEAGDSATESVRLAIDPLETSATSVAIATVRLPRKRRVTRSTAPIERPPGPPFECGECHKQLSNFNSYKYHMRLHSADEPYECAVCGERFKTPNAYDGHMVTHNANNPNTCDHCGKSYRQAASLRSHMLMHTGEKPFTCGICGKGMTQKSGYKKHMLTHSGEKPHQCDVCLKSFRFTSNLFMHKRSHLTVRPFVCDLCDKAFTSKEQLKRHRITHGERKFACNICNIIFNRRATMMSHRARHNSTHGTTDEDAAAADDYVHEVEEYDGEISPFETLKMENDPDYDTTGDDN